MDATQRLESLGQDLLDESYFSAEAQQKRMEEALLDITTRMDDKLNSVMKKFDDQLEDLKNLGADIPGFEEWEATFDEKKWAEENPEEAAKIEAMLAAPEGGYLGDIDLEGMFADQPKLILEVP